MKRTQSGARIPIGLVKWPCRERKKHKKAGTCGHVPGKNKEGAAIGSALFDIRGKRLSDDVLFRPDLRCLFRRV